MIQRAIKTKILLIEDEEKIRKIFRIYFKNENFDIIEAQDSSSGLRMLLTSKPEIVIIDLDLLDQTGMETIKNIRQLSEIPIMACSVFDDDNEIIATLNYGADDYMIKPFNPEVFLAKIHSNLRRIAFNNHNSTREFLVNGPIKLDLLKHEVTVNDNVTFFTPKQYNLLKYFLINKGKILMYREILENIWGKGYLNENQYLRVQIGNIRQKVGKFLNNQDIIHTEPKIGYRMEILSVNH